ncbi:MAG: universal stress protein [Candidatus Latescibacterota bacterium]
MDGRGGKTVPGKGPGPAGDAPGEGIHAALPAKGCGPRAIWWYKLSWADLSSGLRTHARQVCLVPVIEALPRYAEETLDDVDETLEHVQRHFAALQEAAAARAAARGVAVTSHMLPGHAVEAVVQAAEREGADLVAVGRLGHWRILRRVAGGTGCEIACHAPCSVLVVR